MVQEVLGLCAVPSGTDADGPEKKDPTEYGHMLKIIFKLEEGEVPDRNAKGWIIEENGKKKSHKERLQEAKGGN